MHFEVPKGKLGSLREFMGEYAMIVVSILTALALEYGVERWHRAHRAEESAVNMEAEIRANLQNLTAARLANQKEAALLTHLLEVLEADLAAKQSDAAIVQHFRAEAKDNFTLQLQVTTPRHDAWDAAVANQSASWIAPDRFLKFSKAYTAERSVPELVGGNMSTLLNGPKMIDILTDLDRGVVDPRELLHTVAQMRAVHGIADAVMANAEHKVLAVFPAAAPAAK